MTGIDGNSRFVVSAKVVARPVCGSGRCACGMFRNVSGAKGWHDRMCKTSV